MKAVILAGGLGTRLKPFTEAIPKPLLPVGEKAVLEIQMENLRKSGFDEIYLATNYKSDYIKNFFGDGSQFGVKLTISKEEKPLGTVGPITLLKKELTEPFIVMNGDILCSIKYSKLYDYALSKQLPLTISIKKLITPFEFGNILYKGDYVTSIQEKPKLVHYILAGIYVMTPKIFNYIPDDIYFGMDSLIEYFLKNNMKVAKYEIDEYWLDIGRIGDYEKAQAEMKEISKDISSE